MYAAATTPSARRELTFRLTVSVRNSAPSGSSPVISHETVVCFTVERFPHRYGAMRSSANSHATLSRSTISPRQDRSIPRLISAPRISRWVSSSENFCCKGLILTQAMGKGASYPNSCVSPNRAITRSHPLVPPKQAKGVSSRRRAFSVFCSSRFRKSVKVKRLALSEQEVWMITSEMPSICRAASKWAVISGTRLFQSMFSLNLPERSAMTEPTMRMMTKSRRPAPPCRGRNPASH